MNVFQFQIAGAEGDGLRDPFGDEASFDAAEACERNGCAIVRVKALGLNQDLADEPKTALPATFGRMIERGLLDSGGSGKDEKLAVGEDTIDVEEEQLNFFGARLRGWRFWHEGGF